MANSSEAAANKSIDDLTKQYQKLREKQIQAETELQSASEQLDKLRQRAQAEFGTDDLDELTAQLAQLEAENEQRRATYQQDLDAIEKQLTDVEDRLAAEVPEETDSDESEANG